MNKKINAKIDKDTLMKRYALLAENARHCKSSWDNLFAEFKL
jgi:hypothetical protein